ncbi:(2Fe-2S) ferredoxin [Mesorhizobium sp. 113-3-3]|nr:(2Fe-2S) ferredoxin [Mesorhizobium sp. 113-3-3]
MGKGYSPAFTANYDAVAERLSRGEDILLVSGPDDVCAPLLDGPEPHCFNESVIERDRLAARDVADLLALPIQPGVRVDLDAAILARLRQAFSVGGVRKACGGCEWNELCGAIAAGGFAETKVQRSVVPR